MKNLNDSKNLNESKSILKYLFKVIEFVFSLLQIITNIIIWNNKLYAFLNILS